MTARPGVDDWDRHWQAYSETSVSNPATAYRVSLIRRALGEVLGEPGARFLDIGSGPGTLAAALSAHHPRLDVRGVELSHEGVDLARRLLPSGLFLQTDLASLTSAPAGWQSWATAAACSEVLEHLDNPIDLLTRAALLLAPSCRVVVTVPSGPMSAFDRHIGHRRHFTRKELEHVLKFAGFNVDRIDRAGFPFFNLYRLLVISRGRRLIDDATVRDNEAAWPVRALSGLFRLLFRLNIRRSPWGWQLVACATPPPSS
jgi:2-polyprenyl-3-methyl-5-hydroxy-6-metoxy-1,4-benzoquinol methylase